MKINFSFKSIKLSKKELIFSAIGFVLAIVLIVVFINSVSFLVGKINSAVGIDAPSEVGNTKFDLEGLKKIGLQ